MNESFRHVLEDMWAFQSVPKSKHVWSRVTNLQSITSCPGSCNIVLRPYRHKKLYCCLTIKSKGIVQGFCRFNPYLGYSPVPTFGDGQLSISWLCCLNGCFVDELCTPMAYGEVWNADSCWWINRNQHILLYIPTCSPCVWSRFDWSIPIVMAIAAISVRIELIKDILAASYSWMFVE